MATGTRNFEILRQGPEEPVAVASEAALPRGTFLTRSDADPTLGVAATDHYLGVNTRAVVTSRDPLDLLQPLGLELPVVARVGSTGDGGMVSLVRVLEGEAEGADHLVLSGTGLISSGTAVGTELGIFGGKLRVAQEGDVAFFRLTAKPTPVTADAVRIRFEALGSAVIVPAA